MKKVSIAENLNQDFPGDNSPEDCHIQEDPNIQGKSKLIYSQIFNLTLHKKASRSLGKANSR